MFIGFDFAPMIRGGVQSKAEKRTLNELLQKTNFDKISLTGSGFYGWLVKQITTVCNFLSIYNLFTTSI